MSIRIVVDTLPGEVVLAFYDSDIDDDEPLFSAAFAAAGWPRFVEAVIKAAPFGVPPAL